MIEGGDAGDVVQRPAVVAVRHQNEWHAGGLGCRRIDFTIADHERRCGSGAEILQQLKQRARIGFAKREGVPADDAREVLLDPKPSEDHSCDTRRLVGSDRQRDPACAQPLERLVHTRIEPRELGRIRLVVIQKQRQRRRRLYGALPRSQRPGNQYGHTVADHAPDLGERQRRAAKFRQHVIDRAMQISRTVNESSVKIEDRHSGLHKA